MKFSPETEADFLKHEHFVQWVLSPNKETEEYWKRWLQQNPDKVELLSTSRDLLLSFEWKEKHAMSESAYFRILDNLLEENIKQNTLNSNRTNTKAWFLVAASILLFSSVALFTLFFRQQPEESKKLVEYTTKSVPKGAKISFTLPDGSTVELNCMSDIQYPTQFSDTLREVYLTGQAFFDVKKNPNAPFVVHTKNFTTRVLGTSFDIQSYENENSNYVAVLTGKVSVETSAGQAEMILPTQMTTYNQKSHVLNKSSVSPMVFSWRDGVIAFDHVNFNEMSQYLSRWYNVEFVVEKGFKVKGLYTGKFTKETLKNVLNGISYSSHFQYKIVGQKVFITKPN